MNPCFKRWCVPAIALLLAATPSSNSGAVEPSNEPSADRLNLLLITADDLGIQMGCYGDDQARTPRLDQFAQSAVRFEVAYVTQASCSPSRSAMLTGFFPHANGQYGLANALRHRPLNERFRLHPEMQQRTLPDLLKEAGYRTGVIGKLHVNPETAFPFDVRNKQGFGARDVQLQSQQFAQFVDSSGDQPWFMMANFFDPHVDKVKTKGKNQGGTFFPRQVDGLPVSPRGPSQFQPFPFQHVDEDAMMQRVANYYNCVERADAGIGMILDELEQSGHANQTIVIILGDHGPPVGRGKTTCYEAGLRVPFLVRWPGVSTPHVSPAMVSAVDIVPTFLDAANVVVPDDLHGRSLRHVVAKNLTNWRTHLFAEFQFHGESNYFPRRAVRTDRYKLIHNVLAETSRPLSGIDGCPSIRLALSRPKDSPVHEVFERLTSPPEWELYDLENDPWEWINLADVPELKSVRRQLADELKQWRERTNDPFLDPDFVQTVPGQSSRR